MEHGFDHVKVIWQMGPKSYQIWAWLSRGHRWAPSYLEIKFQKIGMNPPPPPPPLAAFAQQVITKV